MGVTLTKMRIGKAREDNPGRARYRLVDENMLQRLALTYHLTCPACPNMSSMSTSGGGGAGHVDNTGHAGHVQQGVGDEQKQHFESIPLSGSVPSGTSVSSVPGEGQSGGTSDTKGTRGTIPEGGTPEEIMCHGVKEPLCLYNHTKYWLRPDGSRVCAICHPPADEGIVIDGERVPF